MKRMLKQFPLPIIYLTFAIVLLLVLVQLPKPVKAQESESECWAVIVGIAEYQAYVDLPYHADDAEDLAEQLGSVWGNDHIKLLTDSMATKEDIDNAITSWLATREDEDDVVLFYWSGYWYTSGYLVPHDSLTASHANDISADELDSWLGTLDSEKIVVMNVPSTVFLDELSGTGRIVLAPSREGESSYWSSDLGHSVFTYHILEALSHFENVDSDGNLELSVEEIFDYAQTRTTEYVSRFWFATQKPQMSDGYTGELSLLVKVTADVEIGTTQATNVLSIDGETYSSQDLPVSFTWAPGSRHDFEASSPMSGESGTRYVFDSWSDENASASRTISHGGVYTADYTTQYYLTIESEHGQPDGEGWHDSRSTAAISVVTPVEETGTKHFFTGWSGDCSEDTASASVYMNEPKTVTAEWRTEYLLTIESACGEPEGEGWYSSGSTAEISVATPVEETGTTHNFTGWSGDYTGDSTSASIIMNEPKTVTAEWRTEYLMTVESDHGEPEGEGWYDSGSTATISVTSPEGIMVRQVFTGWSGDYSGDTTSVSIIMDEPKTVMAEWRTDYLQLYIFIIIVVVILGGLGAWFVIRRRGKAGIVLSETTQPSPLPRRCANCGAELEPGDAFCTKCGQPVKDN
jgi:hypothetical protein